MVLAELHQTDSGIDLHPSNAFDAIHASYLADVDALITRDRNLLKVIENMRADVPFAFAKAVLFDEWGADHLATLRAAALPES